MQEQELIELADRNRNYFQDEGSQMVAHSINVDRGHRILDVCASPGGKTGIVSHKADRSRAFVIAGDITRRRVDLLSANLKRQNASLNGLVQFDAANGLPFTAQTFDSVLVDAPCSGTGTIRHNPELPYLIDAGVFTRFSDKQLSILKSASEMVRPGGTLIYSTCSLEREENEDVCVRFLSKDRGFSLVEPRVPRPFITSDGFARTRPDRDGMDGFFIAAFRRN